MRQVKAIYFAPLLALIALFAWALASPMGASPDDDFHLVSTWCAVADGADCAPGTSADSRRVPEALLGASCYAQNPKMSAGCQDRVDFDPKPTELTKRGNFVGAYPPVYYAVMHLFVGKDILASVVVMRVVNILIFVGLTSALFFLLPPGRRQTLIWMWIISTVPMGLFLLSSNNPSGWAIAGLGTGWLALLGYLETSGRRKWALGAVFVVATLMAAGSRGDAAIYAVLGIGAVFVLTFPRTRSAWKKYGVEAILPVVLVIVCAILFLTSRQTQSGLGGFGVGTGGAAGSITDPGTTPAALSGFGRFAYNLLNIPYLWAGNFGEWGLGWLDTSMPKVVSYGAIACLVAVGFTGLSRMWGRKLFVVLGAGITLCLLPVYVLTQGGDIIGQSVQPRYLLPLIVLFVGLVLIAETGRPIRLTRAQSVLVIGTLAVVNLVALQINMRRYITGVADSGLDLDSHAQWWWSGAPSPTIVWIVGSIAYAALLWIVVRAVSLPAEPRADEFETVQALPMTR